ncbi:MAG: hypothetical protein FJ086_19135 [Deltaproteobacteria bacterium]|nr:hypothetical protein [Deltaproteobacteria bacterium]
MMTRSLTTLAAALLLGTGCPKNGTTPSLSDDDRAEFLSSQLEELRARVQAEPPGCPGWKDLSKKVCGLSSEVCGLSARKPERLDLQKRCTQSQEDCARFTDQAGRCP